MEFGAINTEMTAAKFAFYNVHQRGPGSSVGIATELRLDGPGSNAGGDEIFRPYSGYPVFPGGIGGRGVGLTPHPI